MNWTNSQNDARFNKIESQECLHVVALVALHENALDFALSGCC
jgi:hypothetical protein